MSAAACLASALKAPPAPIEQQHAIAMLSCAFCGIRFVRWLVRLPLSKKAEAYKPLKTILISQWVAFKSMRSVRRPSVNFWATALSWNIAMLSSAFVRARFAVGGESAGAARESAPRAACASVSRGVWVVVGLLGSLRAGACPPVPRVFGIVSLSYACPTP